MKKFALLLISVSVATLVVAGAALAATKQCSDKYNYVCRGTQGADTLRGTNDSDKIEGRGGADKLFGGYGGDYLSGGRGNDTLLGETSGDTYGFFGGWDRDTIVDGRQSENSNNKIYINQSVTSDVVVNLVPSPSRSEVRTLYGGNTVNWTSKTVLQDVWIEGRGDDLVLGTNAGNFIDGEGSGGATGADRVYTSGGNDRVSVADGDGDDLVDCGTGTDTVSIDPGDVVRNCEARVEDQP